MNRLPPPGWYDISLPIHPGMATWPSDPAPELRHLAELRRGDAANVSWVGLGVHAGTHVDAPAHFLAGGATVDALALGDLVGPCTVAHVPGTALVTAANLEALALPVGTCRLLLRTDNSRARPMDGPAGNAPAGAGPGGGTPGHPASETFRRDFCALAEDAARWIVARGIRLVGMDYLSVEAYCPGGDHAVHRTLLQAGVVVLEGLDLGAVPPGEYTLVCLPLRLAGLEGAPARAILLPAGS